MLVSLITILKSNNYYLFEKLYNNIKNQINVEIEWILIEQNNNINSFFYKSLLQNFNYIYIKFDNINDDNELRNICNYKANGEYIAFMNYNFHYELDYISHNINKLIVNNYFIGGRTKIGVFNLISEEIYLVNITKDDLLYDTLIYKKDYIVNNFFNKKKNIEFINNNLLELDNNILLINYINLNTNIDLYQISEEINNNLKSYINKNIELNSNLESDIIYYIGPNISFNPKELNLDLYIQSIIETSEKFTLLCNKVIVYGNFENEIIHNNVKYVKWYKLNNIKTIIILGDAINSINNYKLLTDNIIIIDFYNNFVLKNNINTYYNLFDKVNYFIFYYKDYYENFIKIFSKRYTDNVFILQNPLHYERLFNNNNIAIIKNPYRYYIYNNNLEDCINNLKIFIDLFKKLNNNKLELHIYYKNKDLIINELNDYIHIHNNFNLIDIIEEQKIATYNINIFISNYIDTYNLINCIHYDCIPLIVELINNNNNYELLDIITNNILINNYKNKLKNIKSISWLTKTLDILKLINNFNLIDNNKIFTNTLNHIIEPDDKYKKWKLPYNGQKLSVVIIEPRIHENLKGVLHQMAKIYGNTNVSLYIFHGNKNTKFIYNIINKWNNVLLLNLEIDNLTMNEYNLLLTNYKFWNLFKSEFVLIFQVDSIILKKIPEHFFNYHYIGAPWINNDFIKNNIYFKNRKKVGNGGFSLRNVKVMMEICKKYKYNNDNEDIYFSMYVNNNYLPDETTALTFSIESNYYDDPVGMHNAWNYIENHNYIKLFNKIVNIYN